MPFMNIKVEGIAKLQRMLERADGAVYSTSKETVKYATQLLSIKAQALCPVGETGRLQKSIGYKMTRAVGHVGILSDDKRWSDKGTLSPTIYWRFVEFGTRYAPAQPFFRPAAESQKGPFLAAMVQSGPKIERAI